MRGHAVVFVFLGIFFASNGLLWVCSFFFRIFFSFSFLFFALAQIKLKGTLIWLLFFLLKSFYRKCAKANSLPHKKFVDF